MTETNNSIKSSSGINRHQVLYGVSNTLIAFFIYVLTPQVLLAAEDSVEIFHPQYTTEDIKPEQLVFEMLVNYLTVGSDSGVGISIYLIQKNMHVTKLRAAELLDYFDGVNKNIQKDKDKIAFDILCPSDGSRLSGERIAVARSVVTDLKALVPQKYLTLTQIELGTDEFNSLSTWIDAFQPNVRTFIFDQTNSSAYDAEISLDAACRRLTARMEDQP